MSTSRTPGLASCESGMCFGNQRAFRVLQSWSVRAKEEPGATKLRWACFRNIDVLQSWPAERREPQDPFYVASVAE